MKQKKKYDLINGLHDIFAGGERGNSRSIEERAMLHQEIYENTGMSFDVIKSMLSEMPKEVTIGQLYYKCRGWMTKHGKSLEDII